MNSKQQYRERESWLRGANSSFPFDVNLILNLSIKIMCKQCVYMSSPSLREYMGLH